MNEKEALEERNALAESMVNMVKNRDGLNVLYFILLNLGYFAPIFSADNNIYKSAALADAGRWLENQIDEADSSAMIKIKDIHKYYMKER